MMTSMRQLLIALLVLALIILPSQCLLTSRSIFVGGSIGGNVASGTCTSIAGSTFSAQQQNYLTPRRVMIQSPHHYQQQQRQQQISLKTSTTLQLFNFDNFFFHPYGEGGGGNKNHNNFKNKNNEGNTVNINSNNLIKNDDEEEEENILLLSQLLPKYYTPEELRQKSFNEFQRARLATQLLEELSKKKKKKKNDDNDDDSFLADDAQLVNQMTEMFQRKRLEEQIKLRTMNVKQQQQGHQQQSNQQQPNQQQQQSVHHTEMFQRALLQESLKHQKRKDNHHLHQQQHQQHQQQQQEKFVIDLNAMENDKNEMMNLMKMGEDSLEDNDNDDVGDKLMMGMEDEGADDEEDALAMNGSNGGDDGTSGGNQLPPPSSSYLPVNNDGKVVKMNHGGEGGGGGKGPGYTDGDTFMSINGDGDGDDNDGKSIIEATTVTPSPPSDLSTQLKSLHRMVALATAPVPSPPPSVTAKTAIALLPSNNSTVASVSSSSSSRLPTRLQTFMETTYLPLPPREDTPITSLLMAPFAHIITSLFLSGTMVCYAILSVLDIVMNDNVEENCTRSCMVKAMSIWKRCWDHLFQVQKQEDHGGRGIVRRSLEASQISLLALFYTTQCVIVRAATRSRYASESADAGVASIRYLIYAFRSMNVIRKRVVFSVRRKEGGGGNTVINESIKKERRRFHLLRVISKIRASAVRRINHQRSLLIKQQRMRAEKEYQDKIQSLNEDRLSVERDRKMMNTERANLLSEKIGLLEWYVVTREASDAVKAEREEIDRESKKRKGGKRHWRPRFGYWAGTSGDDDHDNESDGVSSVEDHGTSGVEPSASTEDESDRDTAD